LQFQDFTHDLVELCQHCTRIVCDGASAQDCRKVHFLPLIQQHTDASLGDCSYLNTCHRPDLCRYVHYELEDPGPLKEVERMAAERERKKAKRGDREPRINGVTDLLGLRELAGLPI
jgi:mRNA (2'-O-methyladenosine-N6-)-methyltransferase